MYTLLSVLLIFVGESLSIIAELVGSRRVVHESFTSVFWPMFALITIAGACLVAGYMVGYLYTKNIWLIFVISIGSIVIVEPIVAYGLFREMPSMGSHIGIVLGACGIAAAFLIP
jgi:hypothetical protein